MSLPDTYAGGRFYLPLKVAKLVRLADSTQSDAEKDSVIRKLWRMGWFLDKAGIIWDKAKVSPYVQKHDAKYAERRARELGLICIETINGETI